MCLMFLFLGLGLLVVLVIIALTILAAEVVAMFDVVAVISIWILI